MVSEIITDILVDDTVFFVVGLLGLVTDTGLSSISFDILGLILLAICLNSDDVFCFNANAYKESIISFNDEAPVIKSTIYGFILADILTLDTLIFFNSFLNSGTSISSNLPVLRIAIYLVISLPTCSDIFPLST